jgi:hypothetical protein
VEGDFHGRPAFLTLDLPPLAVVYLRRSAAGDPQENG